MKLGILTSIFGNYNFEQVLDMTSEFGLECMEVACWPQGEGERRYAGVCHIDCENFTDEEPHTIINKCEEKKIFISALGFYANLMDENLEKRKYSAFYEGNRCICEIEHKHGDRFFGKNAA